MELEIKMELRMHDFPVDDDKVNDNRDDHDRDDCSLRPIAASAKAARSRCCTGKNVLTNAIYVNAIEK